MLKGLFKELRFGIYAIKKNIKNSAELRASFLANIIGMAINNASFIILWGFFVKSVGVINGWTAADIIGLLGFGATSYGVVFSGAAGIRKTAYYVSTGSFDRFMLSPKNILLRIATSSFGASAVGDIVFGLICLAVYLFLIKAAIFQVIIMFSLIAVSITMFLAATIAIYSVSFLFIDAGVITDGIFDVFLTPSLFHGGAFQGAMRFIFTFIIPSLLIGALPVEIMKNCSFKNFLIIAVIAFVWFFIAIKLFNNGVKKYESSNFMTFGN